MININFYIEKISSFLSKIIVEIKNYQLKMLTRNIGWSIIMIGGIGNGSNERLYCTFG